MKLVILNDTIPGTNIKRAEFQNLTGKAFQPAVYGQRWQRNEQWCLWYNEYRKSYGFRHSLL